MSCGRGSSVGGETPPPLAMENEFQNRKATPSGRGISILFYYAPSQFHFSSFKIKSVTIKFHFMVYFIVNESQCVVATGLTSDEAKAYVRSHDDECLSIIRQA